MWVRCGPLVSLGHMMSQAAGTSCRSSPRDSSTCPGQVSCRKIPTFEIAHTHEAAAAKERPSRLANRSGVRLLAAQYVILLAL